MIKPSKERKLIKKGCNLIDVVDAEYTANDLEAIAHEMRELDIEKIEFESDYDGTYLYQYTLESEEEALVRHSKELKKYTKFKEREKIKKEKHLERVRKEAIRLRLIDE